MGSPKIIIIGAGPAGLTLARLLQQNSLPVTIYEAEPSRSNRNQGGTLDLHPKLGQLALKEAGLLSEFYKYSRAEGEDRRILKSDGSVLWDDNVLEQWRPQEEGMQERPEIDRIDLRNLLIDSLEPGTIQWGKKVVEVKEEEESKGKFKLEFADGTTERQIDLLVGADGAWSKVRPLLTTVTPFYAGVTMVELWALDVDAKNPWLSSFAGRGSMFMFDEGRALICQRQGSGAIRTYACVRQPEDWVDTCGINWDDANALEQVVEKGFKDCGDDIKRGILETSDFITARKCFMMPVGASWDSRPGVTLLGDAAHLMTPFGGVGVNVAMADALDLAKSLIAKKESKMAKLVSDGKNISLALEGYEKSMFERAEVFAKKTMQGLEAHFDKTGGEQRAAKIQRGYDSIKAKRAAEVTAS